MGKQSFIEDPATTAAGAAPVTLLAVQIIVCYEWFASGITKVASGTFVSGMGADLKDRLGSARTSTGAS